MDLQATPQIIIGTPGRILDMIQSKNGRTPSINSSTLKALILDEADEMLSLGFFDEMFKIISNIYVTTWILLFSATITKSVIKIFYSMLNVEDKKDSKETIKPK